MMNQKESKQVRMGFWLLKLKQKHKTNINQQAIIKNSRKIKNNRKIKAMGCITSSMDHYPRNGKMGDTDP